MEYPSPLLLGATGPDGLIVGVTGGLGDLAGYRLLAVHGPACTVEVSADDGLSWQPANFPHTLAAGELLRLTRLEVSPTLTTIRAVAPVSDAETPTAEPFITEVDAQGYITITNAEATTDSDGYQTIADATATTDPDGYESVERTP